MARGLRDSVEMNGDLRLEGGDMMTRLLFVLGVHLTVMLTSVSTEGGRVAVQVNVSEDSSSSGPLETLRVTCGVGTTTKLHKIKHRGSYANSLNLKTYV